MKLMQILQKRQRLVKASSKKSSSNLSNKSDFSTAPAKWPDEPFEIDNGKSFYFSAKRGKEVFVLGDIVEIYEYVLRGYFF